MERGSQRNLDRNLRRSSGKERKRLTHSKTPSPHSLWILFRSHQQWSSLVHLEFLLLSLSLNFHFLRSNHNQSLFSHSMMGTDFKHLSSHMLPEQCQSKTPSSLDCWRCTNRRGNKFSETAKAALTMGNTETTRTLSG